MKNSPVVKVIGCGTSKDFNAQMLAALGGKVKSATKKEGKR